MQNATHNINYTYYGLYNGFDTLKANLYEDYGKDYSADDSQVTFAIVFGVLFSGVTGIGFELNIFLASNHVSASFSH